MPTMPTIKTLSASSVDIINAIRNNATQNFKDYVPKATANAESIREIGAIIMDNPALQNEFLSALINRIGRVMVTNKMYENPLSVFKKGMLEFGETVEEIFVNIAKPFQYDANVAESEVFKRQLPDVKSAFHVRNFKKFYKVTVQNDELRTAFLSWTGITDLIAKIVDSMYTGASYDEYQTMLYMLGKHILNGQMFPVTIPAVTTANMKGIVSIVKGVSNKLEFMSSKYNLAGVKTHTKKSDQYIMMNSTFDATMDVEVLASAFNMDKAQFMGNRLLVDSFGAIDLDRLAELFEGDTTYTPFTEAELEALDSIPVVLVDKDWFMLFDNFVNFTEQYNGQGLYWNYWYHTWKTFSVSPFANTSLFVSGLPSVTSVTLSPATVSGNVGTALYFEADVVVANFAPKSVVWSVTGAESDDTTISTSGKLTIGADETAETLTVVATSTFDDSKTGSATVTVL